MGQPESLVLDSGSGRDRVHDLAHGGDIIPPVVESLHDPEHDKRVITLQNVLDSFDTGMHPDAQHTGYYNDLDMMVMGMRGMSDSMDRIHMGLWAIDLGTARAPKYPEVV